jgi:hypothetical protein
MTAKPPLLDVPLLRLETALDRLVDAAGVTTNVALDLVPIGVDASGTANSDGVVRLGLPPFLPPCGTLSLGLSVGRKTLAFFSALSPSASAASAND